MNREVIPTDPAAELSEVLIYLERRETAYAELLRESREAIMQLIEEEWKASLPFWVDDCRWPQNDAPKN